MGQLRTPQTQGLLSSTKRCPSPNPLPTGTSALGEANTLFRSNSLASKSMESFLKVRAHGILFLFYR